MTIRKVVGRLENLQGKVALREITFRLVSVGVDGFTNTIHNSGVVTVPVDSNGDFEVELWCDANSLTDTMYRCVLSGSGGTFHFKLPQGTTDINIVDLIN